MVTDRNSLLKALSTYMSRDEAERGSVLMAIEYINENEDCFDNTTDQSLDTPDKVLADVTAGAWILSPDRQAVLLTHHQKLDMLLGLGGHCDGEDNVLSAALREAEEESGIEGIVPISEHIFDVDAHVIPEKRGVPEHIHFDVTFLLQAPHVNFVVSPESKDLVWAPINELSSMKVGDSIRRKIDKTVELAKSPTPPFELGQ